MKEDEDTARPGPDGAVSGTDSEVSLKGMTKDQRLNTLVRDVARAIAQLRVEEDDDEGKRSRDSLAAAILASACTSPDEGDAAVTRLSDALALGRGVPLDAYLEAWTRGWDFRSPESGHRCEQTAHWPFLCCSLQQVWLLQFRVLWQPRGVLA